MWYTIEYGILSRVDYQYRPLYFDFLSLFLFCMKTMFFKFTFDLSCPKNSPFKFPNLALTSRNFISIFKNISKHNLKKHYFHLKRCHPKSYYLKRRQVYLKWREWTMGRQERNLIG